LVYITPRVTCTLTTNLGPIPTKFLTSHELI